MKLKLSWHFTNGSVRWHNFLWHSTNLPISNLTTTPLSCSVMRSLSPFDLVSSGSSIVDSSMLSAALYPSADFQIMFWCLVTALWLSSLALMNMQRELTKYCLLGLYHVDITHKWERAGCGLVCLYFSFFVVCSFCFYVNILTVLLNRNKWNKLKNSLVLSFRARKSSWKNILRCTER